MTPDLAAPSASPIARRRQRSAFADSRARPATDRIADIGAASCHGIETWLLFADDGAAGRPSVGAELAFKCENAETPSSRSCMAQSSNNAMHRASACAPAMLMTCRRLMEIIGNRASRLAGIVHLWSLDAQATESMTSDALVSSARLGCVAVMQLVQALATMDRSVVDNIWLVTHAAQPLEGRAGSHQAGAISAVGTGQGRDQ